MKKIFLPLSILISAQSASAAIKFVYPKEQPLVVVIKNWATPATLYDGTTTNLQDENYKNRIVLRSDGRYFYINSIGTVETDWLTMSANEAAELAQLARNSHRCPVTLQLDRTSFKVISAAANCDPYQ
jgi:hypothetical protein